MELAKALIVGLIQRQVNIPFRDELDLSCNNIGDGGAEAFSTVLRLDCALRILDVSHNSITVAGARRLSCASEGHRTLDCLLVRAVARNRGEQSELAGLQLQNTCGAHAGPSADGTPILDKALHTAATNSRSIL